MRRLVVVCILLGTASVVLPTAQAAGPTFTRQRFEASEDRFDREYAVFHPGHARRGAPLVVYLHGCSQDAADAALGTRWNELAVKRGFVVAYPEQRVDQTPEGNATGNGNGMQCWNWFRPDLFGRDVGEIATIVGITRTVVAKHRLDPKRVYLIGASAGADIATVVAAHYPDVYAAVGLLAGCAYLDCADVTGAAAHQAMGLHAQPMPVFSVQGTVDVLNNVAMGATAVQQWLGTNDFVDDGTANGSVSPLPSAVAHYGADASALDGAGTPGDPCAYPSRFPCLGGAVGFEDSYPYSVASYPDAHGRVLIEHWIVHGLGHAYPGGNTEANWTDPLGPDVTSAAYAFFTRHRR